MAILSTSFRSIANKNHADHTRIPNSGENERTTREHTNTSKIQSNGKPMDVEMETVMTNSTISETRSATFQYRPTITSSPKPSFQSATARTLTNPTLTFGTSSQYSYNPASTTVFQSRKRKVSNGADWDRVKRQRPCSAEVTSWPIEMDTPMEMWYGRIYLYFRVSAGDVYCKK